MASKAGQHPHVGQHGEAQPQQNRKHDEMQAAQALSMLFSGTQHAAQINGGGEVSKSVVEKPTRKRRGPKKQKRKEEQKGRPVPEVLIQYNVGNIGPHNSSRDANNPNVILIDPAALQAQSQVITASKSAQDLERRISGNDVKSDKQSYNQNEKEETVPVGQEIIGEANEPKKRPRRYSKSKTVAEMLKTQTKSSGRRKKSSESAESEIVSKPKSPRSPRRKSPERMFASKDDNNLPPKKRKLAYYRMHDPKSPVGDSSETSDANATRPSVVMHTSGTLSPDKKIAGGLNLLSEVVAQNFSADRPTKDDTAPPSPRSVVPRAILPMPVESRPRVPVVGQVKPFVQSSTGPQMVGVQNVRQRVPAEQLLTQLRRLRFLQMMKAMEQEKKKREDAAGEKTSGCSSGTNVDPTCSFIMLKECQMALTPDEDGDLPIHLAVVQGHMKLIGKFIHLMKSQNKTLDIFNRLRQTPLHLAVITEELEITSLLLANYCNPNIQDRNGQTCVHLAVQRDNTQILHTMAREAKTEVKMSLRNYEGFSPVHIAVQNKNRVAIKSLKKLGSNIDSTDGKSGRTPLFHAVESNMCDVARELLDCGADPNILNYAGYTAAFAANSRGYRQICILLGLYGADVPFKMEPADQTPIKREPGSKVVKQETMSKLGKYITSKDKISGGIYVQNVDDDDEGNNLGEKMGKTDKKQIKSPESEEDVKISVSVPQNVMSGGMVSVNKMELKTEPSDSCPPSPINIRTLYSHNGGNVTVSSASQLTPLKMPIPVFSTMSPMPGFMNSPMPTTPMSMPTTPMSPFPMGCFQFPITIPSAVAAATPQTPVPPDIVSSKPEQTERDNSPNKSSTSKPNFLPSVMEDQSSKPLDLTQRGPDGGDTERNSPAKSAGLQNKNQDGKEGMDTKAEGSPAIMPRFISMQQGGQMFPFVRQVWTDGQPLPLPPVVYNSNRQPFYLRMQSPVMPVSGGSPAYFPPQGMMMMPGRGSPASTTLTSAQGHQMPACQATTLSSEKDSKSQEDGETGKDWSDKVSSNVREAEGKLTLPSSRPLRLEIPNIQYCHIRPQIVPSPLAMTEPRQQANNPAVSTSSDSSGTGHSGVPIKSDIVIKTEPISPTDSKGLTSETKTFPSPLLQQLNSPVYAPHGGHLVARHPGLPITIPRPDGSGSPRFTMQHWQRWQNRMPMIRPQQVMNNMPMQHMQGQVQYLQRMSSFSQGHGNPPQGQDVNAEPGLTSTTVKKVRKRKHKEKKGELTLLKEGESGETFIARNIHVTSEEGAGDVQPSGHIKKKRKRKKKQSTGDESKVSEILTSEGQPTFQQGQAQPIYYMPMPVATSTAGSDIPSVVGALSEPSLRSMQGQILIAPKPPSIMQMPHGMRISPVELNIPIVSVPATVGSFGDSNKQTSVELFKTNVTNSKTSELSVKTTAATSQEPLSVTRVTCDSEEEDKTTKFSADNSPTKPDSDTSSVTLEEIESLQKAMTSVKRDDTSTMNKEETMASKAGTMATDDDTIATKDSAMATKEGTKRQEANSRKSVFNRESNEWVVLPRGPKPSSVFIKEYKSLRRNPSPVTAKGETVAADLKSVDSEHKKTTSLEEAVIKFSALNRKPEKCSGADETEIKDGKADVGSERFPGKDSGVEIGNVCLQEQKVAESSAQPSLSKQTVSSGTIETVAPDGKETVVSPKKETETSGLKEIVTSERKTLISDTKQTVTSTTLTSGEAEALSSLETENIVSSVVEDLIPSDAKDKAEIKRSKRTPMCKSSLEKLQMVIDSVGSGECEEEPPPDLGKEKTGTAEEPGAHEPAPCPVQEEEEHDNAEEKPTPSELIHERGVLRLDSGGSVEIENGSRANLILSAENAGSPPPQTLDDTHITPSKPPIVRSVSMGEPPVLLPETEMSETDKVRKISELSPVRESSVAPETEFESPPKLEPETDIFVRDLPTRDADLFDNGSPSSDDCVILGAQPLTPRYSSTRAKACVEKPPTIEIKAGTAKNVSKSENVPLPIKNSDTVVNSSKMIKISSPKSNAQAVTPNILYLPSPKVSIVSDQSKKIATETEKTTSNSDTVSKIDLTQDAASNELRPSDTASVELEQSDAVSVELGLSDTASVELKQSDAVSVELGLSDTASVELGLSDTASVELKQSGAVSVVLGLSDTASVELGLSDTASFELKQSDAVSVELGLSDTASVELTPNDTSSVELVPSGTAAVDLTNSETSSVELAQSDTPCIELIQKNMESPKVTLGTESSSATATKATTGSSKNTDKEQNKTKKEVRAARNIFDDLKKMSDSPDTSDSERIDKTAVNVLASGSSGPTRTGALSRSVDSNAETATKGPVAVSSRTTVTLTGSSSIGTAEKSRPTTSTSSTNSVLFTLASVSGVLGKDSVITNEEEKASELCLNISDSEEDDNSSFELEMGEVVSVRSKQPAVLARQTSLLEKIADSVGIDKSMSESDFNLKVGSVQKIMTGMLSDPMLASSPVAREDRTISSKPKVLDPQFEISDDSSVELPGVEKDSEDLKHVPMAEVLKLNVNLPETDKLKGDSKAETTLRQSIVTEPSTWYHKLSPGCTTDSPIWSKDSSIGGAVSHSRTVTKQSDKFERPPCINSSVPSVLDNMTESETPQDAPKPPQYGTLIPTVVDD